MKKKLTIVAVALAMVLTFVAGGTLAWLMDKTDPVVNTFTTGDVEITLTENTGDTYKMVPGETLSKDPKVTVLADSEACWLFVKVEAANAADFLTYSVDSGWTALPGVSGVYYRQVAASETNQEFAVLTNNQVTVKNTVTKEAMDALTEDTYPTLTFTAYAIQQSGMTDVQAAWTEVSK